MNQAVDTFLKLTYLLLNTLIIFVIVVLFGFLSLIYVLMLYRLTAIPLLVRFGYGGKHLNRSVYSKICRSTSYNPDDDEFAEALRFAYICFGNQGLKFGSIHQDYCFTAHEEKAICTTDETHHAPDEDCRCGFYSFRNIETLYKSGHYVNSSFCLLKVRLYGRMIEGTKGLRSEFQSVEHIWLPASCVVPKCRNKPVTIGATILCRKNAENMQSVHLHPYCESHRDRTTISFSLSELRSQLKTDVMWTRPLD